MQQVECVASTKLLPDRRFFLGRTASLSAMAAAGIAAAATTVVPGSDGALLSACYQAVVAYNRGNALGATGDDDAATVFGLRFFDLCEQIGDMQAETVPGLKALAALIVRTNGNVSGIGEALYDKYLVNALVRSVEAMEARS